MCTFLDPSAGCDTCASQVHARNKRIPRTCTHVTPRLYVSECACTRANGTMPIITYRPRRIPRRRFQQMLDGWLAGWLEQPLHGGLVLSRRGWPPAFLAHNAERHRQVWTPLGSWRARAPHERGRGTSFSVWPQPQAIILPCSSVIPSSRRRGEDVLGRHVLPRRRATRSSPLSRCSRTGKPSSWRSRSRARLASDYRL